MVAPRGEEDDAFTFAGLLRNSNFDTRLNTGVLVEKRNRFVPLPLDIALKFSAADRKVMKEIFHNDMGAFLSSNDMGAFELPRDLEIKLGTLRDVFSQAGDNAEPREGAQRRQGFAAEAESLEGRKVRVT